eukprot:TRINITY_DN15187_c0_g1_i1.p1 TRINITY_DN15187_c0_g1~~TRINITY_DN15187_c0_g1_i1.p1  ORF type:complete len:563 (-),score=154.83 TRINITY_DN15187_c0_g1_i1:745-2433(-)
MDSPCSIIDDLGAEILAIISPVSVCMLLVVMLVLGLTPDGTLNSGPPIGSLVYNEQSSDSPVEKFEGALLNAVVFVAAVALVTFGLVACFWLRCMRLIWLYMGFSGFTILAWLGGGVALQLIQLWSVPVDAPSFGFLLYNFSVVGVLAVFFLRMPIFLTQAYLVLIGAVVAFWFTHLPEWTTWLLLVAMALYDLWAVLTPGGPLKMLVEMAIERNENIPALIYEARPSSSSFTRGGGTRPPAAVVAVRPPQAQRPVGPRSSAGQADGRAKLARLVAPALGQPSQGQPPGEGGREISSSEAAVGSSRSGEAEGVGEGPGKWDARQAPGRLSAQRDNGLTAEPSGTASASASGSPIASSTAGGETAPLAPAAASFPSRSLGSIWAPRPPAPAEADDEQRPLLSPPEPAAATPCRPSSRRAASGPSAASPRPSSVDGGGTGAPPREVEEDEEEEERRLALSSPGARRSEAASGFGLPDSIKLGLGDFIFYSVLVGRAAMYDVMTVCVSYLAIIAGLSATLLLLAVHRKALPALPISIALGVLFYLLTRLLMDPFVVSLAARLVFL